MTSLEFDPATALDLAPLFAAGYFSSESAPPSYSPDWAPNGFYKELTKAKYGDVEDEQALGVAMTITCLKKLLKNMPCPTPLQEPVIERTKSEAAAELLEATLNGKLGAVSAALQKIEKAQSDPESTSRLHVIDSYARALLALRRDPTVKEIIGHFEAGAHMPDERTIRFLLKEIGFPVSKAKAGRPLGSKNTIIRK
jgi:hypothetical protein